MRIGFPSTLTHEMVGGGLPLARQLSMMLIPSFANVSELLSSSIMSGGTEGRNGGKCVRNRKKNVRLLRFKLSHPNSEAT